MDRPTTRSTNTTTVTTKVDVARTLTDAGLTAEEEKVLRMRYAMKAAPSTRLDLVGQHDPETRAKLAMIEQLALAGLKQKKAAAAQPEAAPNAKKAQILELLRKDRADKGR